MSSSNKQPSANGDQIPKQSGNTTEKVHHEPGAGLRGLRSTTAFRALNFELYVRPNKYVMGIGLVLITGCVSYLAYMNATAENKSTGVYEVYNTDGSVQTEKRKSKWD
ncbi:small integral membrane protein 8 [Ciona intestinalis]